MSIAAVPSYSLIEGLNALEREESGGGMSGIPAHPGRRGQQQQQQASPLPEPGPLSGCEGPQLLEDGVNVPYAECVLNVLDTRDLTREQEEGFQVFETLCTEQEAAATPDAAAAAAWRMERNTWTLLKVLLLKRMALAGGGGLGCETTAAPPHEYASDAARGALLLAQDAEVEEALAIKQWLEDTAPAPTHGPETHKGYRPYTLKHLKHVTPSHSHDTAAMSAIVSAADPDATGRQGKALAPEDQVGAARLCVCACVLVCMFCACARGKGGKGATRSPGAPPPLQPRCHTNDHDHDHRKTS